MRRALLATLFGAQVLCTTLASAGAPSLNEDCRIGNRPIQVRYESSTPVFAQARQSSSSSPPVIFVNPEVYFVGRETQQWLYERQCVHIQRNHAVLREGEKGLRLEDEELADCTALTAMTTGSTPNRSLRAAIESDMQRVTQDETRWRQVLPGPRRRISFQRCPG